MEIFDLSVRGHYSIEIPTLSRLIQERIALVTMGDFRQQEILQRWTEVLDRPCNAGKSLQVVQCVATVSAGTYIRSIAHRMGQELDQVGGIALDIFRTKVGEHSVEEAVLVEGEDEVCREQRQ